MSILETIANLDENPTLSPEKRSDVLKSYKKVSKTPRCRFKQIPQNNKFSYVDPLYPLLGDIPLMYSESGLVTDISLYNELKTYRHIVVTNFNGQRVIAVRPNPRTDKVLLTQDKLLEKLSEFQDLESEQWAKILKVFSQKYDKVMKRQSRKKTKCDVRKKFYVKITSKTEQKKKDLFENYPCVELQFRLKSHQSQLNEIIFDERFIKELGYSTDSFITTVLSEGIPQLMTSDSSISSNIKALVENYFKVQDDGFEIPENQATLIMKNGYVKRINYQMHVLMNYETNTFGMDLILALKSKEEPYLAPHNNLTGKLNEEFVQDMVIRETETDYFLSTFYNQNIQRRYANIEKVCNVKEVDLEVQ